MSKDCCRYKHERRRLLLRIFAGILAFVILIISLIFLIWIILRPTKPRFILQDATLYAFNLSSSSTEPSPPYPTPSILTLCMQVSLSAHNPNDQIGVYYYSLKVYASYRGQQVSLAALLPPTYQGHNDITVWSPFLQGTPVPVPSYAADALCEDQNAGAVLLKVTVEGSVKWKVGTWMSGRYHIYVNCPAYISFAGDRNDRTVVVGPVVKLQLLQTCSVDV